MEYKIADYFGYKMYEFEFMGRQAMLVFPKAPNNHKPWLLKTEYFWAFPTFEKEMLKKGYYLAYISNKTRWHDDSDDDVKHNFSLFLQEEFGLLNKCLPVGMSCGGMHAIYFGAKYPSDVIGLYLDAPVVNLLSCPFGIGIGRCESKNEFIDHKGLSLSDLLTFREHPQDYIHHLTENHIPVFLICGDSDDIVPYTENGKIVFDHYIKQNADIRLIIKEGCNHHPHGLDDPTPLVEWAERLFKEYCYA